MRYRLAAPPSVPPPFAPPPNDVTSAVLCPEPTSIVRHGQTTYKDARFGCHTNPTEITQLATTFATISSIYDAPVLGARLATYCIDGDTSQARGLISYCRTNAETNPWLQIELDALRFVNFLAIHNRDQKTQLGDAEIWISSGTVAWTAATYDDPEAAGFSQCAAFTASSVVDELRVGCGEPGRIVVLVLPGEARVLNLIEVIPFGSATVPAEALLPALSIEYAGWGAPAGTPCDECDIGCDSPACTTTYDVTSIARDLCNGALYCDLAAHESLREIQPCTHGSYWRVSYRCGTAVHEDPKAWLPTSPSSPPASPSAPPPALPPSPSPPAVGENSTCADNRVEADGVSLMLVQGYRSLTTWLPRLYTRPSEAVAQSFMRVLCISASATDNVVNPSVEQLDVRLRAPSDLSSLCKTPRATDLSLPLPIEQVARRGLTARCCLRAQASSFLESIGQPITPCLASNGGACKDATSSLFFSSRPLSGTDFDATPLLGTSCTRWGAVVERALDNFPAAPQSYCDQYLSSGGQ